MYENIKYEELKSLQNDQKVIALKELKSIFPENRDLAKYFSVPTIVVSNLVSKFINGKHVGRRKLTDEEKVQKLQDIENQKQEIKEPEANTKTNEEIEVNQSQDQKEKSIDGIKQEDKKELIEEKKTDSFQFTTGLSGIIVGEELNARVIGIINSLMKDKKYEIELKVKEVS